jgi:Tfp pilus assembly protein PilX
MTLTDDSQRGSAMVLAIGVLALIATLAIVVLAVVVTEKRTSSSTYAHDRAFYSADAATEAGVHWIRSQRSPAAAVDSLNHVRLSDSTITLSPDHRYEYEVQYIGKRHRPGWSIEYKDYIYRVEAVGTSAQQSQAALEVNATRLYREGY